MMPATDKTDRAILALLQDDIPVCAHPYAALASSLSISEEEVVTRMNRMREQGIIRRVGAVLRHGRAGYSHNALTAWTITPDAGEPYECARDRVGETLAASDHISHCYVRSVPAEFPFPLFAMVHAKSGDELEAVLNELMAALPGESVRVLHSVREWKKTSMRYV